MSGGPGGSLSGPGGKGSGPPAGGTGGFMGGPGGPAAGGGMGSAGAGFMGSQGKGAGPGAGQGAGFMGTGAMGQGGPANTTGGYMNVGAPGSAPGQGGFMADGAGGMMGNNQGGYGAEGMYGGGLTGQMADMNNQTGVAAIEKRVEWRFLFFAGACCVLLAGVISVFHFIITFGDVTHWSPCTGLSCFFLLLFGLLMAVLDWPMRTDNKPVLTLRDNIYTFALFLTRFTGRGLWYIFLGTHVWVALYDASINPFFGISFTLYLVILGIAAAAKGMLLSKRLHDVQREILDKRYTPQQFMQQTPGMQPGLNRAQFKQMVTQVMNNNPSLFSEAEYDYIINALCFKPRLEPMITYEEVDYWLQKGPMLLV